jgi:hypothetical protein
MGGCVSTCCTTRDKDDYDKQNTLDINLDPLKRKIRCIHK